LDRMQQLCRLLEHPENAFSSVHVTGTNGKGSVTTKIAKGFECSGLRAGLFTSPHISCFRERIQINGFKITEERVVAILKHLFSLVNDNHISATFFELTTCLAFVYFAEERVDIACLEVGIGGTFDATNVVTPRLSVITSVSRDHTELLGSSIDEIACEKGGIVKPLTPILIGPHVPRKVISKIAEERNSSFYHVEGRFSTFDQENNAIARHALELLQVPAEAIEIGIQSRPFCRMQYLSQHHVVLDVAHNPDGLQRLFASLKQQPWGTGNLSIVCGLSATKEIAQCLDIMHQHACHIHFVKGIGDRGMAPSQLSQHSAAQGFHATTAHPTVQDGLEAALAQRQQDELIVICGTFFIMDSVFLFFHQ
jgi:dihydrofolate synthase/folylpolyglutamate synthase